MRLGSVAVLTSLIAFAVSAQQRETIEVRLIEVDAVVTDRDGNPVHGLTADDFELFENGKRQKISNFAEYRDTVAAPAAAPKEPAPAAPQVSVARPAPRTIILFIDALPVRGPARTKLFDSLRTLVARTMREGDRAQLIRWHDAGALSAETPLTTDRGEIEAAVESVERRSDMVGDGPSTDEVSRWFDYMAQIAGKGPDTANRSATMRYAAERELAMMRRKSAAMQRIVSSLTQTSGRSVFIYVSDFFPAVAGKRANTGRRSLAEGGNTDDLQFRNAYTTRRMLDEIIAAANANGVSFYALRPEIRTVAPIDIQTLDDDVEVAMSPSDPGLEAMADQLVLQNEIEALSVVTEQTGGALGVGPNAVDDIINRVVRDVSSYYTLAYRAQSDGSDRERKIEIRPKNRNHVIRTRTSIVEKSDRTRARDLLLARLFERGPAGDLQFEVTTGEPVPAGKNRVQIPVEVAFPAESLEFEQEGDELAAKFTVLTVNGASLHEPGVVTEQSQRITAPSGSTPAGTVRFKFQIMHDLKPTTVVVALLDEKSGQAGTQRISLGK